MEHIFDTHAHYDDTQYDGDRDELLRRIHAGGVEYILTVGDNLEHSAAGLEIAGRYGFVYSGVGVHPCECGGLPQDWLKTLERMAADPRVKAIGEIGLDYYWKDTPREVQLPAFEAQLELAKALGLPVSLHDRDAHGDMMETLRRHRPKGALHRFSGSAEMAEEAAALGLYLGFGGSVTYKGSKKLLRALEAAPADRILLETDCPYLAPEPWRGGRCHSGMLTAVAEVIASVKGMTPQEAADMSCRNARELFGI